MKVIRDGKEMMITATVEELEPQAEKGQSVSQDKNIGLTLQALTPALARRLGLRTTEGLVITDVTPYSEADRRGLQAGMIILEVNREKVTSVKEFEDIVKKTEAGDEILLLVRSESDNRIQDIIVPLQVK
jgi:serine protease Do